MFFFNQFQCNEVIILVDDVNNPNCVYHDNCKAKVSQALDTLDELLTYILMEYRPYLVE